MCYVYIIYSTFRVRKFSKPSSLVRFSAQKGKCSPKAGIRLRLTSLYSTLLRLTAFEASGRKSRRDTLWHDSRPRATNGARRDGVKYNTVTRYNVKRGNSGRENSMKTLCSIARTEVVDFSSCVNARYSYGTWEASHRTGKQDLIWRRYSRCSFSRSIP